MQDLIKITLDGNGKKAVSAKELYLTLGYDKSQWARWYTKSIVDNDYAIINEDWQPFDTMSSDKNVISKDFALSLSFAKKLSMLARTEKGEKVRDYFIECEKIAQNPIANLSRKEILQMAMDAEIKAEALQLQNELQAKELKASAPKIEFVNKVLSSTTMITTTLIAKELGMSAMELNKKLFEKSIQYKQGETWVLKAGYQNKGYTKTKTHTHTTNTGDVQTTLLTVWTEQGRMFIHQLLNPALNNAKAMTDATRNITGLLETVGSNMVITKLN